jgi:hypothetical protein
MSVIDFLALFLPFLNRDNKKLLDVINAEVKTSYSQFTIYIYISNLLKSSLYKELLIKEKLDIGKYFIGDDTNNIIQTIKFTFRPFLIFKNGLITSSIEHLLESYEINNLLIKNGYNKIFPESWALQIYNIKGVLSYRICTSHDIKIISEIPLVYFWAHIPPQYLDLNYTTDDCLEAVKEAGRDPTSFKASRILKEKYKYSNLYKKLYLSNGDKD